MRSFCTVVDDKNFCSLYMSISKNKVCHHFLKPFLCFQMLLGISVRIDLMHSDYHACVFSMLLDLFYGVYRLRLYFLFANTHMPNKVCSFYINESRIMICHYLFPQISQFLFNCLLYYWV